MMKNVAVVGATGAVGIVMRQVLKERNFPIKDISFFSSERSRGKKIEFKGKSSRVEALDESSFDKGDIDIALFSIPAEASKHFAPIAARNGAIVIDNSSAFRMDPEVPLVVPEVNAHAVSRHKGIIANPNCSTIEVVQAIKPLHERAKIKRMVVTTFQSVSGVSLQAMDELRQETRAVLEGKKFQRQIFPHQIAFNLIPQIPQENAFGPNLYTSEEMKMVNETKKILEDDSIRITTTNVRVPVLQGHSACVNIETEKKLTVEEARKILSSTPGVVVQDDPARQIYPMPVTATDRDETFVGRIREDQSIPCGLNFWIVSDNLRKGAATNAVQIAELLL